MILRLDELQAILLAGGSIRVPATGMRPDELESLASTAKTSGGRLEICLLDGKRVNALKAVAAAGGKNVLFDFT